MRLARSAAALILLTAAFYWKLAGTEEFVWFDHSDMCYLELPRLEFQAREIHRGRFPLWNPHIWMGQPLIGQMQPGPLHPFNVAFLSLPLTGDGHLRFDFLNYYYVFLHCVAAFGVYLLCRGLRRSPRASVFAGCAYSFAGFTGSAPWLDVLLGAIGIPFVAHYLLRALRTGSQAAAALAGMFAGSLWLSGHHEIPVMTLLAMGTACLWTRGWQTALIAFPIAGLTGAAQLWPAVEFGRLAKRWGPANGPVGWNDTVAYLSSSTYSLPPKGLLGLALPGQGTNADSSMFLGLVTMALAAIALFSLWRLRPVRWFTAAASAAAVFSLGDFTPLHGWLYWLVPLMAKARVPSRGSVFLHLALVVLAAYGADQILRGRATALVRRAGWVTAAIGAAIAVTGTLFHAEHSHAVWITAFAGIAFPAVVRVYPPLLLFLVLTEWSNVFTGGWQSRYAEGSHKHVKALRAHADIADHLQRQTEAVRVRVHDADVPANFGETYSIDMQEGYSAAATENLLYYARHTAWAQRLYAITHYMARKPDLPETMESAFAGTQDGVSVFRVREPVPRARAVHRVETVPSPFHLEGRLSDPSFDVSTTLLLAGRTMPMEDCPPGKVSISAYAPNRVRLKASMNCQGAVVLADTYFPGWKAFVDGQETEIVPAYGGLRAISVASGAHEIEFRYRPVSIHGGLALTALGLLLTAIIVAREKRRPVDSRNASS